MRRPDATLISGLVVAAETAALLVAESRARARPTGGSRTLRLACNGALGGAAIAATALLETPLVLRAAAIAERRGWGLLPRLKAPPAVRTVLTVALLDYGMYAWHVALHRVPLLWRLHLVHHADRECGASTALRIHTVEMLLSVAVRVVQTVALGIAPGDFVLWQRLFGASVIFHHANVTLPPALDRALGAVIMTPRRHGLHHLAGRDDQHANWSAGLVLWDRLHGTLREGEPAGDVGVPAYRSASDVTLAKMLALPFGARPDPFVAP